MFEAVTTSPSRKFSFAASAFVAGVALHALDERAWAPAAVFVVGAVIAASCFLLFRTPVARFAAVLALAILFGLWRYDAMLSSAVHIPRGPGRFVGVAVSAPAAGPRSISVPVGSARVRDGEGWRDAGSMTVRLPHTADAPAYGDIVRWSCEVPASESECLARDMTVVGRAETMRALRTLFRFRDSLRRAVRASMPEPEASVMLGLLIGDRGGIPPDLAAAFRATGTSHILAVSGYNVSKVALIALVGFCIVTARRRIAAAAAAAAVTAFAAVAGGEPSVVRAAVMGCMALAAAFLGRKYSWSTALPFAAAAMLAADPTLLRHDAGFLLSFSALLGLHAFAPGIDALLSALPNAFGARRAFADSAAASLATLPVVLAMFGASPVLGPVANVLVLPVIPAVMVSGILAAMASPAGSVAASVAALPAVLGIRYVETVVRLFAEVPLSVDVRTGPFMTVLLCAALVAIGIALGRIAHARRSRAVSPYASP